MTASDPPRPRRRQGTGSIKKRDRRFATRYTNLRGERKAGPSFVTFEEAEAWLNAKAFELHAEWLNRNTEENHL